MTSWTLHGSGRHKRTDWTTLHELTNGWQAAWADTSGFHHSSLPARLPATTHLWAWTTQRWLRVRVDADHWWASLLTTQPDTTPLWSASTTIDHVVVAPLRNWGHTQDGQPDRRIKQYRGDPGALHDHAWIGLVPTLARTGQFVGHVSTIT